MKPHRYPDPDRHHDHDHDDELERILAGPFLEVPAGFAQRVLVALPDRPARDPATRKPARAGRAVEAALLAVCAAFGAAEMLIFLCGLWVATGVGAG